MKRNRRLLKLLKVKRKVSQVNIPLPKKKIKEKKLELHCLNCGHPLRIDDKFCANCGQKNIESKLKFKRLILEFLGSIIAYDAKLWKSLYYLITKPGKITEEYVSGKRARFVNPYKFYFSVSIIYFILVSFLESENIKALNEGFFHELQSKNIDVKKDNVAFDRNDLKYKKDQFHVSMFYDYIKAHPDKKSQEGLKEMEMEDTRFNNFVYHKMQDAYNFTHGKNLDSLVQKVMSYASLFLFLFLPFFALYLKLFYMRRDRYYMEHLVFAFHTQTMLFLSLVLFAFIEIVSTWGAGFIPYAIFLVYLFIAMKRYYKQSIFKTLMKFILLNIIYVFFVMLGFILLGFISFLLY
ncbi:DUF3667 domain-containing protein [Aureivirga marina]|uniref:DUF3667 domain-containing protein n=1 Tax=Aureivirga marina TaxID=1182451 RepID=UPI0018CA0BEE|nr:DUF3667 domain-containing protein [Aureivirga marina]